MSLTAKQEAYAQSIADGLSQSDAYRANYSAHKMSDKQIWEEASKVASNPKVSQRVAELRDALSDKQLWSRAESVDALKAVVAGDNYSAQVSAVKELNSMHGFNEPAKVDHTSSDGSMKPQAPVAIYQLPDNGRDRSD